MQVFYVQQEYLWVKAQIRRTNGFNLNEACCAFRDSLISCFAKYVVCDFLY